MCMYDRNWFTVQVHNAIFTYVHSTYSLVYDHVTIPVSMRVSLILVFGKGSLYTLLETGPHMTAGP